MLFGEFSLDRDGMHDREDAGAPIVLAFDVLVIREEPADVRRVLEDALRNVGRDQRVDLTALEHLAEIDVLPAPFDFDAVGNRVRNEVDRIEREIDAADDPPAQLGLEEERRRMPATIIRQTTRLCRKNARR